MTTRIALVAFVNVVALQILLVGAHVFDAYFSAEQAIDTFVGEGQSFPAEPPFYSVGMLDQSVPFYLERTVTQVASKGELADGIAAEPDKYIDQMSVFEERWRAADEAYAVMSPKTYGELEAAGPSDDRDGRRPTPRFCRPRTLAAGPDEDAVVFEATARRERPQVSTGQCRRCLVLRATSDTAPRREPAPITRLALRRSCQKR